MNLTDMHILFRQFAQQMGMQNVRAILPEQIDRLINTSISDTLNQVIQSNIASTSDRVVTDNSKLGQVNALRTLYKVKEVSLVGIPYYVETEDGDQILKNANGATFERTRKYIDKFVTDTNKLGIDNLYFWVNFDISYAHGIGEVDEDNPHSVPITLDNVAGVAFPEISFETNYFPVRVVDDIYLADALNDFTLRPVLRSPILTVHDDSLEMYIDRVNNDTFSNGLVPYIFRVGYIKTPNVVAYNQDQGQANVDCDMPESLHVDIVKHAVELWQMSLTASVATEQTRQQRAQQERARNYNRDENN